MKAKKSQILVILMMNIILCGISSSCGPSDAEKALDSFCSNNVPQVVIHEIQGYTIEDCVYSVEDNLYCNNVFFLNSVRIYKDKDRVTIQLSDVGGGLEQLTQLANAIRTNGEKILLEMASSKQCILTLLEQVQSIDYTIQMVCEAETIVEFDRETIAKWDLPNTSHDE